MITRVKVLIVGATKEGISVFKELNKEYSNEVLLVSASFPNKFKKTINCIENTIIYASYNHGLLNVYTKDSDQIVCENLVLATGDQPKKMQVEGGEFINYNPNFSPTTGASLILGSSKKALETALKLTAFGTVFISDTGLDLKCELKTLRNKVLKNSSINWLPNCFPTKIYRKNKATEFEVLLNTFSGLTVSNIFADLGRSPEESFISSLVKTDNQGKILINSFGQSTSVFNIFAVGECGAKDPTECIIYINNHLKGVK